MEMAVQCVTHRKSYQAAGGQRENDLQNRLRLPNAGQTILLLTRISFLIAHRGLLHHARPRILNSQPQTEQGTRVSESAFEQKLYEERREKLRQFAALGENPYPNQYLLNAPNWTERDGDLVPWIKRTYDPAGTPISGEQLEAAHVNVSLAGRVMAHRLQGKAGFAQIQQGGQRL